MVNRRAAFTLIELLIVVAIIAILAAIAVPNFLVAKERTLKSADAANLKTVATALQLYRTDYGALPPADREAGPFPSHTRAFNGFGNGPAAGGSWDGLPWLLIDLGYLGDWKTMFTPTFLQDYAGGETLRGGHVRFHNFRYAYNSAALSSGGASGGAGNIESGEVWLVRNLWLGPEQGFYGGSYPSYPADYRYPWGEGDWDDQLEHVLYADLAVRTVIGGTDKTPDQAEARR